MMPVVIVGGALSYLGLLAVPRNVQPIGNLKVPNPLLIHTLHGPVNVNACDACHKDYRLAKQ